MGTIRGYSSKHKNDQKVKNEYTTVSPIGAGKYGPDVTIHQFGTLTGTDAIDSVVDAATLNVNAHGLKVGNLIRFTSGLASGMEVKVSEIVDSDNFTIDVPFSFDLAAYAPVATDTFSVYQPVTPTATAAGAVAMTPIQFVRDGVDTTVTEDTGVPANNRPLPVKLTGVTGDIMQEQILIACKSAMEPTF